MSNTARKLRRIQQRKQARAEAKLWTPEDWVLYVKKRNQLIADGSGKEAASRRAWLYTRKAINDNLPPDSPGSV